MRRTELTAGLPFAFLLNLLVALSGCGVQYHIQRLDDDSSRFNRVEDAEALAESLSPGRYDADVADAMIRHLTDRDPAIRYIAANSLGTACITQTERRRAVDGLVDRLSDRETGGFCVTSWTGVTGCGRFPPVRVAALHSLARITGMDYGFDQQEWKAHFE